MPRLSQITGAGAGLVAGLLTFLFAALGPTVAAEEALSADEYTLKAAFLYNLAKFVDWPASKFPTEHCPLVIGVAGKEACQRIDDVVKHKTIAGHAVVVRAVETEKEAKTCHILFVARSQEGKMAELLKSVQSGGVLTFGETENFLGSGGMIRFYIEAELIRLEIDDPAIRQAGMEIKSAALSTLINKKIARLRKVER